MKKIVFLPLDERPCNLKFPLTLFDGSSLRVLAPPRLGNKKQPADPEYLQDFLRRESADADGLLISLDMLLYGGLIPSRLHFFEEEELRQRLSFIRSLKTANPQLTILAFQVLMRCPTYSSDDEEPPYYKDYGAEIHRLGACRHRLQTGDASCRAEAEALEQCIPAEALADYLARRQKNLTLNLAALDLLEEGVLDCLVVPQDDSRPWGFTALDQARFRSEVKRRRLQSKVLIYPGSDEVGLSLLARLKNKFAGRTPAVFLHYASEGGRFVVPKYEDRPLGETVKWQLLAAGLRAAETAAEADFIMGITAPPAHMLDAECQPRFDLDYDVRRSLRPWFEDLLRWLDEGKPVVICDNAYGNGGDLDLLALLDSSSSYLRLAGYAGWNTSSNTMGTALALGVRYLYEGEDQTLRDFLLLRYVEDFAYQAVVRQQVAKEDLPPLGLSYLDAGEEEGEAAAIVRQRLRAFMTREMPALADKVAIEAVRLPWRRMFEVDLSIREKRSN